MFSSWLEQLNICHSRDRFPVSAFDSSTCDSQPCFISVCRVPLPVPGSLSSRRTVHARQCFLKAADTINDWTSLSVFCTGLSAQELYHKWLTEEQWHFAWRGSDYLPGFEVPTWTCMQAFICVCTVSAPAWIISIFRDITNIFFLLFFFAPEIRTFWIHGKASPESPLPHTDAHYNVSVSKQGQECRALTARWSHHWINAPHFWVYLQQCALPPEFTSLPSFPLSSCPLSKLLSLMNPHYPTDVQPTFRHDFFLLCPSVARSCFDVSIYVDIAPNC